MYDDQTEEQEQSVAARRRVAALFAEHRRAVLAEATRLTAGDVAWAEDVVQETFVRAWRHWARLTADQGSVRGWLLRVAHNLVIDEYRSPRRRRGELALRPEDDVALPDPTEQLVAARYVRDALSQLSPLHREALEVTFFGDRTALQAAHMLGVPVGTVKSRVFYGLRMLRTIMHVPVVA